MPLRTKIFVIVSICVLAILGITVGLLLSKRHSAPTTQTAQHVTTPTSTAVSTETAIQNMVGLTVKPLTPEETQQAGVKQFAKIFIERYYTYSSDSNFQNIRDVESLVTASLWKQMSPRLSGTRSPSGAFVGVTTKVYGTSLADWSASKADVKVLTQQSVEKDGATTSKNQNYTVEVVKQGSTWLVSSVATAE